MIGLFLAAALSIPNHGVSCSELKSLHLPDTVIKSSVTVAAGPFVWPKGAFRIPGTGKNPPLKLPEYCRVKMVLRPTTDSNINVELWLPVKNWNGKFMATGNGGWAGSIQSYGDMQVALQRGYATAATDTGHSAADGPSGMFALGHPQRLVDFAYRAMHLMTVRSKQLIDAFYPTQLNYSYYKGCSTGGRQGVMEAQRYPGDFDGIIAGALANRHIHMHTAQIAELIYLKRHPEAVVSNAKADMVHAAVMKQCDTLHEGFLNDPEQCSFNFSTLLCKGAETDKCLTRPQLKTVETFYTGVKNSRGKLIFSGSPVSVSMNTHLFTNIIRSANPNSNTNGLTPFLFDTVRILGFQNPNYDWHKFNLDRDMPRIDAAAGFVDAVNPDLRAFKAAGGKLLMYHGWDDPAITPENTIYYYNSVLKEMGSNQGSWMRLFMVPGMGHCSGGPGPYDFDTITALEKWREDGQAPASIIGTNPKSGLSRPLCPYPQYAKYNGSGEMKNASNWTCTTPGLSVDEF